MRVIVLCCGTPAPAPLAHSSAQVHLVDAIPTRAQLRIVDDAARELLPVDPTPSLADIQARPDVPHLGTPGPAPQAPYLPEPLRIIVHGSDAALSAVLTRLMRADALFAEVAFVPTQPHSTAAATWGIDGTWAQALTGHVHPIPTIRTDKGQVVAGAAELTHVGDEQFLGEVIVDDATLLLRTEDSDTPGRPRYGTYGARIVPTIDAPGLAAAVINTAAQPPARRLWQPETPTHNVDAASLRTGRAVQCGGRDILVTLDGVPAPRPVTRTTFYRHLRDTQAVRPAASDY